jgi:hypothetical protein
MRGVRRLRVYRYEIVSKRRGRLIALALCTVGLAATAGEARHYVWCRSSDYRLESIGYVGHTYMPYRSLAGEQVCFTDERDGAPSVLYEMNADASQVDVVDRSHIVIDLDSVVISDSALHRIARRDGPGLMAEPVAMFVGATRLELPGETESTFRLEHEWAFAEVARTGRFPYACGERGSIYQRSDGPRFFVVHVAFDSQNDALHALDDVRSQVRSLAPLSIYISGAVNVPDQHVVAFEANQVPDELTGNGMDDTNRAIVWLQGAELVGIYGSDTAALIDFYIHHPIEAW